MIAEQWKKIGIQLDVKELERSLAMTRMRNNEHQIVMWTNDGTELLYPFPRHAIPVDPTEAYDGPAVSRSGIASNGAQGKEPTDPKHARRSFELFRAAVGQQKEERDQDRPGDLEDRGRQQYQHRHGRPVAGRHGRAPRQEQRWATSRRGRSTCPALPDAAELAPGDVLLQERRVTGQRDGVGG